MEDNDKTHQSLTSVVVEFPGYAYLLFLYMVRVSFTVLSYIKGIA